MKKWLKMIVAGAVVGFLIYLGWKMLKGLWLTFLGEDARRPREHK